MLFYVFKHKRVISGPGKDKAGLLLLLPVWNILGPHVGRFSVPRSLEYSILHIDATGFANHIRHRSNACTVSESIERVVTSKAIEKHGGSR